MSDTKKVSLYDGKINIFFNNNARNRYVIEETGGSPVGVTTMLRILAKEGLMLWPMYEALAWLKVHPEDYEGAAEAYQIKSDKGKDVGTEVHAAIEDLLKGGAPVPDKSEILKPYAAFVKWYDKNRPQVLSTEQIVYSKQFDYCGTYDMLLEIDGKVILADCKTTNVGKMAPLGIYPEMFLQLGAYALAHHEENPLERIDDAMIIRVGKDGVLNTLRASELGLKLEYLELSFAHVVNLYKLLTPLKKQLSTITKGSNGTS